MRLNLVRATALAAGVAVLAPGQATAKTVGVGCDYGTLVRSTRVRGAGRAP